jgi:hypothetical protein
LFAGHYQCEGVLSAMNPRHPPPHLFIERNNGGVYIFGR